MNTFIRLATFAVAAAAGTAIAGWWTVPVLAVVWVRALPHLPAPVRTCMAGAALGWAVLLGRAALGGPVGVLARRAGGVLHLPGWGLILVTLLFPALLAGVAARTARPAPSR